MHLSDLCDKVEIASNGLQALDMVLTRNWSLVVLDLRLPGLSGIDICKKIRESGNYVPILMLTSKSTEFDRVLGLDVGADDYLTKVC